MAGRIALMVKGLPSIGMDEAANRFRKYYPEHTEAFHESESFKLGVVQSDFDGINEVVFTNAKGGFEGGGGLTRQSMKDLRQLQSDFEGYKAQNPAVYINKPSSSSRGKLYKRMGFKGDELQALDARRIATDDLPYTNALDPLVLGNQVTDALGSQKDKKVFVRASDGTVRSTDRVSPLTKMQMFAPLTTDKLRDAMLEADISSSLANRSLKKQDVIMNTLRGSPNFMERMSSQIRQTQALQQQEYSTSSDLMDLRIGQF